MFAELLQLQASLVANRSVCYWWVLPVRQVCHAKQVLLSIAILSSCQSVSVFVSLSVQSLSVDEKLNKPRMSCDAELAFGGQYCSGSMGVDHGGAGDMSPSEFGVEETLMRFVPSDFCHIGTTSRPAIAGNPRCKNITAKSVHLTSLYHPTNDHLSVLRHYAACKQSTPSRLLWKHFCSVTLCSLSPRARAPL